MLDEALDIAGRRGAREVVIGMAHRGRLNVLAHTVGRPYEAILAEFEGEQQAVKASKIALPEGGTGDVKYHHGASGTYTTRSGKRLTVTLSPNPSATWSSSTRSSRAAPAPTRPAARAAASRTTRRRSSRC